MENERNLINIEKEFEKVIGYDYIKKELYRICDIMLNEEVYKKLGVSVPNGIILDGDPGMGKTLMARCFINASGRKAFVCRKDKPNGDFVNQIKETFEKARQNAPSIILLDDMDKFANEDVHHRNAEEYVTVQACIDETKGQNVFVFATTNDLDNLPDSLKRAGRFDNIIKIENPSIEDAQKIIEHYIKEKHFVTEVDSKTIIRLLNGSSCAELETVINEAGIYAGFERKNKIETEDIIKACMRVIHRAPEFAKPHSKNALKRIAYHEAGHAIIADILMPDSVNFVSVRRHGGNTGGFTSYFQDEDYWLDIEIMKNRVIALLAGKAATEIVFGVVDTGTKEDLHRAFDIVVRFVDNYCSYGFDSWEQSRNTSSAVMERKEMRTFSEMERLYNRAKKLLVENREFLDAVANALIEKEVLTNSDIKKIKENLRVA